jgi:RNA polymerase sigma-70 factor (ECF subfamily)
MPPGRRRPPPRLTLVTSSTGAADARRAGANKTTTSQRDWSALMARAQDGDRQAYRTLLDDVTPFLRALAARRFKDPGDIEDTLQEVLLTVHAVRHAYDPRRPFGPWLVAIANRRIIDRLRRQIRNQSRETEFTAEHETFLPDPTNLRSGFDEISGDEATLIASIANLPPDQREAIRLLKLKEMSLKEAALATGRTVASLKVATHRAIKSLQKMLRKPSETP